MKNQFNLKIEINSNDIDDLKSLCTLIREGWELMHIGKNDHIDKEVHKKDTKAVLIRQMD